MASEKSNKEVVALLLGHGVDISTQSDDQDSALSLAADEGFKGVVDLPIKAGAGPKPRGIDENVLGSSRSFKENQYILMSILVLLCVIYYLIITRL